jgi:hypothetical protein
LMLNKTEEEIDKLRDEQFNFQSDWFFKKVVHTKKDYK